MTTHDAGAARPPRTSVEQHRADVAALLAPLVARRPVERLPLAHALDRVLGADVSAPVAVPAFRNSQMDGFAVRTADVVPGRALPVVGEIAAGSTAAPLAPGTAVRIMTGAPVPDGADAVVPVEETSVGRFGADVTEVVLGAVPAPGAFVREAGSDVRAGDVVLPAGTRLAATRLAALAACGIAHVEVVVPLRVSVVSTGAELVAPGERLGPGQVYDANGTALAAAVRAAGGTVAFEGRSGDDPRVLAGVLADAAALGDLVLTSGGVSQGAYEVVKDVLGPDADAASLPFALRDTSVEFRTVAMQPGGPQGLGRFRGTPILTFPGNPVSAQVSFVVFVRELVAAAAGRVADGARPRRRLDHAVTSPPGRRQMLRGALSVGGGVRVVGGTGSHLVAAMARADVLIDVPADVEALDEGAEVEVWEL
ncbi:molybdopterin molybdochelatase [Sediminihabitans luteus]|uniref:Molybdopterin molybdenumtransferase n=1 Tax=Sediminihabitans luteus TaxID=1138585 RepID=A0A2M9CYW3_9CELL|nr:gephyrin-like molybdotransferase Glp [Sediminihabitans luteus]PJJ77077.1 molybdopterin molybdochelatase [Sediminihabitans luteus]GIJ00404.1 putative molybdopterin biosynthesis protein MoeA [Sediminihabitans luteus]